MPTTATLERPRSPEPSRAVDRDFLIDSRYMSDRTAAYQSSCLRKQLPAVIAFPWRRYWHALRVDMPGSYALSDQARERIAQHIANAQHSGFRHPARFLTGGFMAWGILPE